MRSMLDSTSAAALLLAYHLREAVDDLRPALDEVFCDVVEDLRAGVRGGLCPLLGLVSGFDCVADVFAIAERGFADEFAIGGSRQGSCSRSRAAPACRRCIA